MINYIIQVLLFQALFLAVYDFFLQKETFFKWNRIYLLATPFLSFIIPLMKFDKIQQAVPQEYFVQLPTVLLNPETVIIGSNTNDASTDYLSIIFYVGVLVFSVLFFARLYSIIKLIVSNEIIKQHIFSLVILETKQSAFSFFNYIFINKRLVENKELNIIQHELVHCKQKHTIDLLIFEILKIILWFNPMIYIYQKRITVLHEYISDAEVVKETDKHSYFNTLLSETFNVENISFINQFYKHSLIKKRIAMITKNKSENIQQLKYLLIIPLLFGMLIYSSCTNDAQAEINEMNTIISNEMIPTNGKYFEGENGVKIFTGTSLQGQVVSFDDMTKKEKEISNNFKNKENSMIEYNLVIDANGDRVHFLKIPVPPARTIESNKIATSDKIEVKVDDSVSFSAIEEVPVFPGCEGTQEELRICLQENITKHVNQNFNTSLTKSLNLSPGTKRIFVMFQIDKEGNIIEAQARAPHQSLADEAIKVVNSLPKMIPGKQHGENVGVKYSLPIAFKVE